MKKTPSIPVERAKRDIAEQLDLARRQQRVPAAVLADRCNISRATMTRLLAHGEGSIDTLLRCARSLGMLDSVVRALDPLETDLGRVRAMDSTPKRVR